MVMVINIFTAATYYVNEVRRKPSDESGVIELASVAVSTSIVQEDIFANSFHNAYDQFHSEHIIGVEEEEKDDTSDEQYSTLFDRFEDIQPGNSLGARLIPLLRVDEAVELSNYDPANVKAENRMIKMIVCLTDHEMRWLFSSLHNIRDMFLFRARDRLSYISIRSFSFNTIKEDATATEQVLQELNKFLFNDDNLEDGERVLVAALLRLLSMMESAEILSLKLSSLFMTDFDPIYVLRALGSYDVPLGGSDMLFLAKEKSEVPFSTKTQEMMDTVKEHREIITSLFSNLPKVELECAVLLVLKARYISQSTGLAKMEVLELLMSIPVEVSKDLMISLYYYNVWTVFSKYENELPHADLVPFEINLFPGGYAQCRQMLLSMRDLLFAYEHTRNSLGVDSEQLSFKVWANYIQMFSSSELNTQMNNAGSVPPPKPDPFVTDLFVELSQEEICDGSSCVQP